MSDDPPPSTAAAGGGATSAGAGLILSNTDTIRSFLLSASASASAADAGDLSSQPSIPYRSLRAIYSAAPAASRPPLRRLLAGSGFVLASPKPREKSEELKARLRKLAEMEERRVYKELVKDILPKEDLTEPFSSYKDQMGFGLHVALMMFTGYLVGYFTFRALFDHNAVLNVAGGILGLVCGMLLETVLFIIRTSDKDIVSSGSNGKLKKQ